MHAVSRFHNTGLMRTIANATIVSVLDFDHGEGYVDFSWVDADGIDRSLRIDMDGHCSREMPIRSGSGVEIVQVHQGRVQLRFTTQLAEKFQLEREIEFVGDMPNDVYVDFQRLTEYF